jgi:hypothetical protein
MPQIDDSANRARVALLLQDSPEKVVFLLPTGTREVSAYRIADLSHAAGCSAPEFIARLRQSDDVLDVASEADPLFRMERESYEEALAASIVEMRSAEYAGLCAASSTADADPRVLAEQYLDVAPDIAGSVDEYAWSQVALTRADLIATGMLDGFDEHATNIASILRSRIYPGPWSFPLATASMRRLQCGMACTGFCLRSRAARTVSRL